MADEVTSHSEKRSQFHVLKKSRDSIDWGFLVYGEVSIVPMKLGDCKPTTDEITRCGEIKVKLQLLINLER